MIPTISRVSVFLLITLSFAVTGLITAIHAQGQEAESDYYYVGNEKISLSVSENYQAFALKSDIGATSRHSNNLMLLLNRAA